MSHRTVAAFDFDKTMTYHDTLLPFLFHLHPIHFKVMKAIQLIPTVSLYKMGYLENHDAKEKLLKAFLRNCSYEKLEEQAKIFSLSRLSRCVKPEALQRLHWHQKKGHECILISAGLELYLKPWADSVGLELSATRLHIHNGRVTGKIDGQNCFGQEKVNRLLERFGPKEGFTLYAYGDSRGDQELLALADHPFYRIMPPCH
ncbi:MAG TPA: HAD family hydrolase [Gammaproteobacteria bacterium]|nr:HAD family hydrolase [Gammaproteobacteria bacterium]